MHEWKSDVCVWLPVSSFDLEQLIGSVLINPLPVPLPQLFVNITGAGGSGNSVILQVGPFGCNLEIDRKLIKWLIIRTYIFGLGIVEWSDESFWLKRRLVCWEISAFIFIIKLNQSEFFRVRNNSFWLDNNKRPCS